MLPGFGLSLVPEKEKTERKSSHLSNAKKAIFGIVKKN
jgi:hypothetical protein